MKKAIPLASKILLVLAILTTGYYFFFLKPKADSAANEKLLSKHYSILLQNRLSYVELTKLDPKGGNFNLEKSNLVGTLQKTIKEGRDSLASEVKIPRGSRASYKTNKSDFRIPVLAGQD